MIPYSMYWPRVIAAAAAMIMAAPAMAQRQHSAPALARSAAAERLPGGASSVQETYGAWTVGCRIVEDHKVCGLSQVRVSQQTGQRSFAIELKPPVEGKTEGMLILPFGLALGDGVKLTLDDKALGQTISFSTCVPDGCIVPVSFPTVATNAIKKAKVLAITATPSGSAEPVAFAFALEGLTQALDRIAELAK